MIAQVTSTPAVTGTGPKWKSATLASGESGAASRTLRTTTERAMRTPSAIMSRVEHPLGSPASADPQERVAADH